MGFDHVKLEKGMYRESGKTFTQVLESLDPSENYGARGNRRVPASAQAL